MQINFPVADRAFFYHVVSMVVRYNYGMAVSTNDPLEDGVKILNIESPLGTKTMELRLCFESPINGNPIFPVDAVKETIADKLAVFYVTTGRLLIVDVKATMNKMLNSSLTAESIDDIDCHTLNLTRACGYSLSNTKPYRQVLGRLDKDSEDVVIASEFLLDLTGNVESLKPLL